MLKKAVAWVGMRPEVAAEKSGDCAAHTLIYTATLTL
jgi:hypothetical protein